MKVVREYPLLQDEQIIPMPLKPKLLTAQLRNNRITIWALVDPTAPMWSKVEVTCVHSEEVCGKRGKYLGTIQYPTRVMHVFGKRIVDSPYVPAVEE